MIISGVFYGYPAELLARWCVVSIATAEKWKRGEQQPTAQAMRLFELHRDRRVLDAPVWRGWVVNRDRLVDPEGNETTQGQLRAYFLIYQLCRELARDDPGATERFNYFIAQAS